MTKSLKIVILFGIAVLVIIFVIVFINRNQVTSATFEGEIYFGIIDRGNLPFYLSVSTKKDYGCSNFGFKHSVSIKDNTIKVILGDIMKPNFCLTSIGPASFREELDLKEDKYILQLYSKSKVDKYNIVISNKNVLIEEIEASFSKVKQTNFYRTPENLISVKCFRYHYGCESEKEILDELCPVFFNEIERVAKPADESLIGQGPVGGYCQKVDFDKGICKLYYYKGSIDSLKQIFESSNSYNLEYGYRASCSNASLYYKRIDTWLGETFCC